MPLPVASTGPFGPTVGGCLLLMVMIPAPFVLIALAARSLLRPMPISLPVMALLIAATGYLAYLLWPFHFPRHEKTFWLIWWLAGCLSVMVLPAVLVREGFKRGWLRGRRRSKRKQVKTTRHGF
jgi:hypothetical protein